MLINVNVTAHRPVIVIRRSEYDLLRDKANLFNQVCAIQRKKISGEFKYDWDYVAAMGDLLNELIIADVPEEMAEAKAEKEETNE